MEQSQIQTGFSKDLTRAVMWSVRENTMYEENQKQHWFINTSGADDALDLKDNADSSLGFRSKTISLKIGLKSIWNKLKNTYWLMVQCTIELIDAYLVDSYEGGKQQTVFTLRT